MRRVVCMHGPGRRIVDFAVVQLGGHVAKYEDACREADRTDTWLHQAVLEDIQEQRERHRKIHEEQRELARRLSPAPAVTESAARSLQQGNALDHGQTAVARHQARQAPGFGLCSHVQLEAGETTSDLSSDERVAREASDGEEKGEVPSGESGGELKAKAPCDSEATDASGEARPFLAATAAPRRSVGWRVANAYRGGCRDEWRIGYWWKWWHGEQWCT
ncbi:hypothetical protein PC113_g18752 [Phytophthora cactorum]|nr:hypothetical protein PC113_g18752 [Phytophthora cactorum]KAG3064287.1 hypothetical protein PC122_g18584 [Phytophthora cactorum]